MGSRVERDLGGGLGRRAFYPPGPRSCPQTPAGLSVAVGNASGWGIDRLEVCAGSFSASWMGPQGAQVFLHRCFLNEFHIENIVLPNVDGPHPIR